MSSLNQIDPAKNFMKEVFGDDYCGKYDAELELKRDKNDADKKIALVLRWIEANAQQGAKAMVKKFGLSYHFEGPIGNGVIAKVGFYTDESMRFKICELHLPSREWFRD